jgi:hypothetical protein
MQFDEFIEKISPLLLEHGFDVTELSNNFIQFDSDLVRLNFTYNPLERQSYTHVGYKDGKISELDSKVLNDVFQHKSASGGLTPVDFLAFFKGKGFSLLQHNTEDLDRQQSYILKRSQEFTKQIIEQQLLQSADFASRAKDYQKFIQGVDRLDKNNLSDSYKKKYSIALKKIKQ